MSKDRLLGGGLLYTMSGSPFQGDLLMRNGKIAAVDTHIDAPDAEYIDVTGMHVLPGLIDAHCHAGLLTSGTRDKDHNENCFAICPQVRAIDSIYPFDVSFKEAVSGGVTTCLTGPGSQELIGGTFAALKNKPANAVEDMLIDPAIAMKAALGENPVFIRDKSQAPHSRMGSAALIRQTLANAQCYQPGPNKRDLGMEALQPVINREIPLKIHCHRADDIMTAIRICDEFNVLYTLDHCTEGYLITDKLLAALEKNCVGIIIGPVVGFKGKHELANRIGWDLPYILYKAGIPFAIMTDFYETPTESLINNASFCAAYGVPDDVALKSVTKTAAKIAGLGDRIGSLAPGMDADVALFSGDPLDVRSLCMETYIEGEPVYKRAPRE